MTLIEVLDTAVKIGLGAAITALAGHWIAKGNHDRELRKIAFTRRQDTLEQVTENAEIHFAAWRRYCSSLGGIYSGANPPEPSFSEVQWKKIHMRDKAFLQTRDSMGHAVARLRLPGATEAADVVNDYNRVVGEFRDKMILQRQTPDHQEFKTARRLSIDQIRFFYVAVGNIYMALPK